MMDGIANQAWIEGGLGAQLTVSACHAVAARSFTREKAECNSYS